MFLTDSERDMVGKTLGVIHPNKRTYIYSCKRSCMWRSGTSWYVTKMSQTQTSMNKTPTLHHTVTSDSWEHNVDRKKGRRHSHARTHADTHTHICTHTDTWHSRTHTHTRRRIHAREDTHAHTHADTYTYTRTHTHQDTLARTRTHVQIRTHADTHRTCMHTHTRTQMRNDKGRAQVGARQS